eukprot:1159093-Pelagomonas_calceolata.AAC.7
MGLNSVYSVSFCKMYGTRGYPALTWPRCFKIKILHVPAESVSVRTLTEQATLPWTRLPFFCIYPWIFKAEPRVLACACILPADLAGLKLWPGSLAARLAGTEKEMTTEAARKERKEERKSASA